MISRVEYSEEKNLLLKATRGINFEDVITAIEKGNVPDDIDHFDKSRFPNQRILVIKIKKHAYAVPYAIDKRKKTMFLKTAYPNRVLSKKYLKGQ